MSRLKWMALCLGLALVSRGAVFAGDPGPAKAKGLKRIENFDYRGVTVNGGRVRAAMDEVRDDYLRIPNDDLLKGFRQRRTGCPGA